MKETFFAYVGGGISEHDLEQALVAANKNFDYTVKVLNVTADGGEEALFGKIVRDSYSGNCRDPEIASGMLAVGGYDLALLHEAALSIASGAYDPHDRDADQRVVGRAFRDFDVDAFSLLNRYMPFSAAFFDTRTGRFVVGRGRDLGEQESYANLFYGRTASGDLAFSNNEALLVQFVDQAFPVEPNTYFADGAFTTYREPSFRRTDDAGIESNYSNARDIIALVNRILEQAADDSLRQTIERLFDEYFESQAPRERISAFVDGNLDVEVAGKVRALIDERIEGLASAQRIDAQLTSRYKQILDAFIGVNAVPHTNIVKLGDVQLAHTGVAYYHEKFEQVLTQVQLDEPVMLIGPAGSGKNYAVSQVAEGLGLPMYYTNNASNEFKLTGFIDAGGTYRDTQFYRAFKNGGVFFLDEIDNSDPSALIVINSALANGYMAFPHETIERHPDFRCVAAANTWGKGSNLQYVGRNVLDGATLDRFDMVFFDYDRKLERALYPSDELLEFMWSLRDAADECRVPHIVSTRAIGKCYKKECYGMDIGTILRTNVIRSLTQDDMNMLVGAVKNISSDNKYLQVIKTIRIFQ
ncbi:MAG: AAA family ATPase [Eggerthellaceae bacterium]|nr:AAA family ATPase [Eggerthellaceae bacterium]